MRRTILTGAALLLAVTACGEQVAPPDLPAPSPEAEQSRQEEGGDPSATGTPGEEPTVEENQEPVEGEQDSPGDEATGEEGTYVFNRYGDEDGFPDLRPTDYVATEFTTFSDMEWSEWSDEVAHGEGGVSGTWCLETGCQEDPYDVEVELGDPVEVGGGTFFSTYTITDYGDMSAKTRQAMQEADDGRLSLPPSE
ncbi:MULTISPECIES: hypothetical protein [Nocardiopsis]|uniref:Lipoprotein n=1 Tax=Nocardiopsis sinuspersici TaxID=501010 RepID=A0A1V3C7G6_9ACTN|nr:MULTISPECIES: hypothetical protein [Nocardiopsis]OOC56695.1 hypothetical protein NOSIN_25035 [Nocardiopsis sinuspersici]